MRRAGIYSLIAALMVSLLSSCATYKSFSSSDELTPANGTLRSASYGSNYESRLPEHMNTGGTRLVLVDPNVHAWGAYDADGSLIRAGLATAGGNWCPDIGRPCRTTPGSYRIHSLGAPECKSSLYPRPRGGAPMPYCMFFNGSQGLHGSYEVVEGNESHGCVRMRVEDAEWMRYNFATVGTRVVVRPY